MADYFRIYISYHFGGAYHDIKLRLKTQSIADCWNLFNDTDIWVVGMPNIGGVSGAEKVKQYILENEINGTDLIISKDGKWDKKNSNEKNLVGNGAWIARPMTEIFQKVNAFAEKRLDRWFEKIKEHPVLHFARCCQKGEVPGYPVYWSAILGDIFHPYQAVYLSHVHRGMPRYQSAAYQDKSENVET